MKNLFKNKALLLLVLGIGLFTGLVFTFGGHAVIKATSDDKFCTSCHAWMDPMVEAYHTDPHGGKNDKGLKATCVSCHLPQDSLVKYLVTKGVNGIVEVTSVLVNNAEDMDWQKHREKRESFVYDSGCMSCHVNIETTDSQSEAAKGMHKKYTQYKDAKKEPLSCVSCHKNVGHKNLSKIIYDRTHEPVGEWEDDK